MIENRREFAGRTERECRFYITSVDANAQCRIRKDHAPANLAAVKSMATNLVRRVRGKG